MTAAGFIWNLNRIGKARLRAEIRSWPVFRRFQFLPLPGNQTNQAFIIRRNSAGRTISTPNGRSKSKRSLS
jgi:hypothetical protein